MENMDSKAPKVVIEITLKMGETDEQAFQSVYAQGVTRTLAA